MCVCVNNLLYLYEINNDEVKKPANSYILIHVSSRTTAETSINLVWEARIIANIYIRHFKHAWHIQIEYNNNKREKEERRVSVKFRKDYTHVIYIYITKNHRHIIRHINYLRRGETLTSNRYLLANHFIDLLIGN